MKPLCSVPFVECFQAPGGGFRSCCAASPAIISENNSTVAQWWNSKELDKFRDQLRSNELPDECSSCRISETNSGHSFRTAVNAEVGEYDVAEAWPMRWNIIFGNICNLACWTCTEHSSSTIEQHKKKLNVLPSKYKSAQLRFDNAWPTLKKDIIQSYAHHDTVTLTILGGEPLYNKTVLDFLSYLKNAGLSTRTKLEFHTNATQYNNDILEILKNGWKYICIFFSIDAVGKKAEWLRYGCSWEKVSSNIEKLQKVADYSEAHCTVSILNLFDLVDLKKYCQTINLTLRTHKLSRPSYMSLEKWPNKTNRLPDIENLRNHGYGEFVDIVGKHADTSAPQQLRDYISQFNAIRKPLRSFDQKLADMLFL